jgi:hypothetical protein
MTAPSSAKKITSEKMVFHLADGTPTTDRDKAVSAEVTTTYEDGTTSHTLLRRSGADGVV